jgi:hypothetical protein
MPTTEELRKEFELLRRQGSYDVGLAEWNGELANLLPTNPVPQDYVDAARKVTCRCPNCSSTGRFQWGASVNGRMTHSGPCFRCNGKGRQNAEDGKRNWGYDNHRRVV